ncbi:MAG: FAD-dependent oxidoreductase, partial [bacterium]|nr:FAD-dependent oxidoreductase [bacterium]
MKRKVIIIGGVAAGTSAAAAAKRANPELEITIIEKRSKISVGACSFPYFIGGLVDSPEKLYGFTPKSFKEKKGTEVLTEHAVLEINMSNRQVSVKNLKEDKLFTMDFDILVIATGSVPIRLPIPGRELDGIFNLKFFEEAVAIKDYMKGNNVRTVGIVGGGNIGLELVENFARLGIRSFIVERFPDIVFGYEPEIREVIREELKKFEIPLYLETTAMEYSGENGKVTGIKTDKGNFHADMVIESVGIK